MDVVYIIMSTAIRQFSICLIGSVSGVCHSASRTGKMAEIKIRAGMRLSDGMQKIFLAFPSACAVFDRFQFCVLPTTNKTGLSASEVAELLCETLQ